MEDVLSLLSPSWLGLASIVRKVILSVDGCSVNPCFCFANVEQSYASKRIRRRVNQKEKELGRGWVLIAMPCCHRDDSRRCSVMGADADHEKTSLACPSQRSPEQDGVRNADAPKSSWGESFI